MLFRGQSKSASMKASKHNLSKGVTIDYILQQVTAIKETQLSTPERQEERLQSAEEVYTLMLWAFKRALNKVKIALLRKNELTPSDVARIVNEMLAEDEI